MLKEERTWQALSRAVDVAIANGTLEPRARGWGKVVLLEALASVLGVPPTKLRNLYYRRDPRLEAMLLDYAMTSVEGAIEALRGLEFRRFSPIVWKRPLQQLAISRNSLAGTVSLLRTADANLRARTDAPVALRREIGTVAAEVMACALTFFDGTERWSLLSEADAIFRAAMGPLTLEHHIDEQDAALFARFWENRATRCGLEWGNIWDDPSTPPTIGPETLQLAVDELDHATRWMRRHGAAVTHHSEEERLRQFSADKAKWYAKAGRFQEAHRHVDQIAELATPAARADGLLVRTLEQISANALDAALRTGSELAEHLSDAGDSIAPVTSSIMVHNIELMRDRRPKLSDRIVAFLRESPVASSEHVNLPRYRRRLAELGYVEAAA